MISRMTRVQALPRFSSWRPLRCWMLAHLECPGHVLEAPAVPALDDPLAHRGQPSAWADALAGVVGSLSVVAVIVTLGLLAYAPLGAAAASLGLAATFVTAAVGGVVYAMAGRSALPAAGPSSATALILASLVARMASDPLLAAQPAHGLPLVVAACAVAVALSGLLQVLLALAGLARLARLVPRPVLAGFMNGVALLILVGQLPLLAGLLPGTPLQAGVLQQAAPGAAGAGPGVAGLDGAAGPAAQAAARGPGDAAGGHAGLGAAAPGLARAGAGAAHRRGPRHAARAGPVAGQPCRRCCIDQAAAVLTCAAVLALVGSLESALNLLAVDQQLQARHDPRRELLALGLTNLACGALGGLPAVALRARALAIARAGGRSARAALVGSVALALLYVVGTPLLAQLPLPVLGALMLMVGIDLLDRVSARQLLQWWRGEGSAELRSGLGVMALVCGVTLWQGFAAGVALGVLLSMAIFIARMNRSLLRSRLDGVGAPVAAHLPGAGGRAAGTAAAGHRDLGARRRALLRQCRPADVDGAVIAGRRAGAGAGPAPRHHGRRDRGRHAGGRRPVAAATWPARAGVRAGRGLGTRPCAARPWSCRPRSCPTPTAPSRPPSSSCWGPRPSPRWRHATWPTANCCRAWTPSRSQRVCAATTELRLFAGDTLFRQGDAADGLYVLTLGSVSVIGHDGDGTQRFLSISPGMMLGETALLDGGGRSADAVADSFAVLQHLSRAALQRLADEHPAIAAQLYRNIGVHLSRRLRAATLAWSASQR
jgi:SulP family sulfate permease